MSENSIQRPLVRQTVQLQAGQKYQGALNGETVQGTEKGTKAEISNAQGGEIKGVGGDTNVSIQNGQGGTLDIGGGKNKSNVNVNYNNAERISILGADQEGKIKLSGSCNDQVQIGMLSGQQETTIASGHGNRYEVYLDKGKHTLTQQEKSTQNGMALLGGDKAGQLTGNLNGKENAYTGNLGNVSSTLYVRGNDNSFKELEMSKRDDKFALLKGSQGASGTVNLGGGKDIADIFGKNHDVELVTDNQDMVKLEGDQKNWQQGILDDGRRQFTDGNGNKIIVQGDARVMDESGHTFDKGQALSSEPSTGQQQMNQIRENFVSQRQQQAGQNNEQQQANIPSRRQLADTTNQLCDIARNLEPESPEAQQVYKRIQALQNLDQAQASPPEPESPEARLQAQASPTEPESPEARLQGEVGAVQFLLDKRDATAGWNGKYDHQELKEAALQLPSDQQDHQAAIIKIEQNAQALSYLDGLGGVSWFSGLDRPELENVQKLLKQGWTLDQLIKEGQRSENEGGVTSSLLSNTKPLNFKSDEEKETAAKALQHLIDNTPPEGNYTYDSMADTILKADATMKDNLLKIREDLNPNASDVPLNRMHAEISKQELQVMLDLVNQGYSLDYILEATGIERAGDGSADLKNLRSA